MFIYESHIKGNKLKILEGKRENGLISVKYTCKFFGQSFVNYL